MNELKVRFGLMEHREVSVKERMVLKMSKKKKKTQKSGEENWTAQEWNEVSRRSYLDLRGSGNAAAVWVMCLKDFTTSSPQVSLGSQEALMCAKPGILWSPAAGLLPSNSMTSLTCLSCART